MLCWGAAYVPSALAGRDLAAAGRGRGAAGPRRRWSCWACWSRSGDRCAPGSGSLTVGWLALTQTVLFYGATFWGIAHAGAGLSAVLANTDPLFVAVLADACARRAPGGPPSGPASRSGSPGRRAWSGRGRCGRPSSRATRLVVVGGALAWSVGTVVASRSVRGRADPLALAGWQMAVGGVVLGLRGRARARDGAGAGWREAGLMLGLGGRRLGGAARALLHWPSARAPASEVSAWFFLIPVIGVLSAWPLLGETPSARPGRSAWWGCRSGLWLVLGGRGPERGAVGRLPGATVSTPMTARRT